MTDNVNEKKVARKKTISVDTETHKRLYHARIELGADSVGDVVDSAFYYFIGQPEKAKLHWKG